MNHHQQQSETLSAVGSLLGKHVQTPDGIGILISVDTPANGLYYEDQLAKLVVWYSVDGSQNGWVQRVYTIDDVKAVSSEEQKSLLRALDALAQNDMASFKSFKNITDADLRVK